ncbi:MAG: tRNA pseudouridine(55) synthase TruB [Alphaproteobacteria bacterium]|nr:tRNA pseudouridine(55) synthase TruB [Alphaproteobacteria bacterium]
MTRKRRGRPLHGWLVLDKPQGMTSAQAVAAVRRHFDAAKAGHGGTLDPLATGVLPIAFGEATKTMAYAVAGRKTYRFSVRWGERRETDDVDGRLVEQNAHRPTEAEIRAALPTFTGRIEQVPPAYSAIKIDGKRAYARARKAEVVTLAARTVEVASMTLIDVPDPDHATFEVVCGKGTYMRSLARDLGEALGTSGCIAALRRLAAGPFTENRAISLDYLTSLGHDAPALKHLLPVETGLDDIPALALTEEQAARLRHGQAIQMLLGDDHRQAQRSTAFEKEGAVVCAMSAGRPVAVARLAGGTLRALRVLNL